MNTLDKLIGKERWQQLATALKRQSSSRQGPELGTSAIIIALVLGITPALLTSVQSIAPASKIDLPTLAFGVCSVLGIVARWRLALPFSRTKNWSESLSLTHTAVAFGCIPAVLVLIFAPDLFAERQDVMTAAVSPRGPASAPRPSALYVFSIVIMISMWVALVEEIVFRGVLVSILRRWKLIKVQRQRDIFAAVLSASIFGLAHYSTWGPIAALALIGLGIGFAIAYIANGEQLLPLILYHFAFDLLSISVSVYS